MIAMSGDVDSAMDDKNRLIVDAVLVLFGVVVGLIFHKMIEKCRSVDGQRGQKRVIGHSDGRVFRRRVLDDDARAVSDSVFEGLIKTDSTIN